MKNSTSTAMRLLVAVCEAAIGIILIINPITFTAVILSALGILLILTGIAALVGYFRADPAEAAVSRGLVKGITLILGGAFCLFNPQWFIAAFPLLTILYGIVTLLLGIFKVQAAVDMLRLKFQGWGWHLLSAAISILCAVIIITNPFASTAALWLFVAWSLIIEAVVDVVVLLLAKRTEKKAQETGETDDISSEGEL